MYAESGMNEEIVNLEFERLIIYLQLMSLVFSRDEGLQCKFTLVIFCVVFLSK